MSMPHDTEAVPEHLEATAAPSRLPLVIAIATSLALGFLIALLLPLDPFGLRDAEPATASGEPATASEHGVDNEYGLGDGHRHDDSTLWTCGMHPQVVEEQAGQCPICGMNLVPMRGTAAPGDASAGGPPPEPGAAGAGDVAREDEQAAATVQVDPAMVQAMNVRTETVERRDLTRPIRTVGYLEFDQERMVTVTTKYSGWVEKVYVNYVGETVRKGQPLFEIYSPEMVQTERELLSALDFARKLEDAPADARERAESLVRSARTRLGYWDMSDADIDRLEATGEVFRSLKVTAPSDGLIMKRMPSLEGMAVSPGMEIFHIADLSSLWLAVEIYEDQLAWVTEGTPAEIEMSYFPGESFRGRVRFVEPEFSEQTRTVRARIEVPNPRGRLRKGMFATVEFRPVAVRDAVAVPSEAILRTGHRSVVVEALGGGRFLPRTVTVGHEAEGYVQILDGLEAGAEVVTSSQFLLDSESKFLVAIEKMVASRHAGH